MPESEIRKSHIENNQLYFWTATINGWEHLLKDDKIKMEIIASLQWLKQQNLVALYAYVIMPNHLHFVWSVLGKNGKESPQGSFLKFTAHRFRQILLQTEPHLLNQFKVDAANKVHEFWQRDSLAFQLYSREVTWQKIEYTHNNPVAKNWQLAETREAYRFSSADFYYTGKDEFGILTHIGEIM